MFCFLSVNIKVTSITSSVSATCSRAWVILYKDSLYAWDTKNLQLRYQPEIGQFQRLKNLKCNNVHSEIIPIEIGKGYQVRICLPGTSPVSKTWRRIHSGNPFQTLRSPLVENQDQTESLSVKFGRKSISSYRSQFFFCHNIEVFFSISRRVKTRLGPMWSVTCNPR